MGVPLLAGRAFTEHDVRTDETVPVIVNEALARRFYQGNAVGRNLILNVLAPKPARHPIVGVVADAREQVLDKPAEPTMYFASYAGYGRSELVLIRAAGDPLELAGALRREVASLDPEAPVSEVRTMEQVVDKSLAGRKFSALLIAMFGALALALAAVGLYGVVSYSVTQRSREMGLRMALGAQQAQVLRMVIGEAMKMTIVGAAVGAVAAAFAGRALASEFMECARAIRNRSPGRPRCCWWSRCWVRGFRRGGRCEWIRRSRCGTSRSAEFASPFASGAESAAG